MDLNVEEALRQRWRICPLKWAEEFTSLYQIYRAEPIAGGSYEVIRWRGDLEWTDQESEWGPWSVTSRFLPRRSVSIKCDDAEEGKRIAEQDWITRLLPALEVSL